MNNSCPHSQKRPVTFPDSQANLTKHLVQGVQGNMEIITGYTQTEAEYIEYAKLIQIFVEENSTWINNILENCYEEGMEREIYIAQLYRMLIAKLSAKLQESDNSNYVGLMNGIGTAMLIINTLLTQIPNLKENVCIQHCESIMREIHFHELPKNPKDKIAAYSNFIKRYLKGEVGKSNEGKLYCPVKYTTQGNAFVKQLIGTIYQHFPV